MNTDPQRENNRVDVLDISHKTSIVFVCNYPDENNREVLDDIAKGLDYLGFFDGLVIEE